MKKITVKLLAIMMMLSMVFSSSALAATDDTKTSAWDSFTGLFTQAASTEVGVQYKGHVQDYGNMPQPAGTWVTGADQFGTTGESKRVEGLNIELTGTIPAGATIQYKVHIQDQGDSAWITGPDFAGTVGLCRQIEAIYIKLVDADGNTLPGYSVSYMGHIQDYGDSAWKFDGAMCGTQGEFKRIEAISIKIVKTTDLTDYNVALENVENINKADYTADSYGAIEEAIDFNVVTVADTQAKVDAATKAITNAQANLVFAGQAALDTAEAKATALKEEDYTADSFAALVATKELPDTTNEEVVDKTNAINAAGDDLEFAGQAALDTAVAKASALTKEDYTADSFAALIATKALPETTNAQVVVK